MSGPDAEVIAAHVTDCSDVVELSAGPSGTIATYLPGRRIVGVRVHETSVEVHVGARWDAPIPALAREVRAALAPFTEGRSIEIVVEDLGGPIDGGTAAEMPT
jgi:hypothetical protein